MLPVGKWHLLLLVMAALVSSGIAGCSTTTTTSGNQNGSVSLTPASGGNDTVTTQPTTAGPSAAADVTVTGCKQEQVDTTQVDVSGTILNHSSVTSDYSFVVDVLNNSLPSAQAGVTHAGAPPGLVEAWSTTTTIAGSTSGSYTCRVTRVIRTPAHA
jgi:hypothetical protein